MFSFSLDMYPEVELLGQMVVLFFIFEETPCYIPQWLHQVTFPPTVYSSVQLLSRVQLFEIPRTAEREVSLSITSSQSLLKLMSIQSVMPSNHLILCHPLLLLPSIFTSIRVCSNDQFFTSGSQSIGVSASASVLPMNIQD